MKKITYLLLLSLSLSLALGSCKKDGANADEILKTIPSEAGAVVVADMESIVEGAGCKIKGSAITPGDEVKALLGKASSHDRKIIDDILAGKTGIDPSLAALFYVGSEGYFTGILADPDQFKNYIESRDSLKFENVDGIDIFANVAVKGNRFWYATQPAINPQTVAGFMKLSEKQSFLSTPQAEKMHEIDEDIMGWASISSLLSASGVDFATRTTLMMSLQTIYADPQDIYFTIDFDKGELEASLKVLDSKCKPTRVNFPTAKVDLSTVNSLTGEANLLCAGTISQKLVEQVKKGLGNTVPAAFASFFDAIGCLDGTIAVAADPNSGYYDGVITTNGKNVTSLTDLLGQMQIPVKIDGNILKISKGTVKGSPVANLSPALKGAMFGCVITPNVGNNKKNLAEMKYAAFSLHPEDGSLELKFTLKSDKPKENILLTIIRNAK